MEGVPDSEQEDAGARENGNHGILAFEFPPSCTCDENHEPERQQLKFTDWGLRLIFPTISPLCPPFPRRLNCELGAPE